MVNIAERLLLKDYNFRLDEVDDEVRNGVAEATYVARAEFLTELKSHLSSRSSAQPTSSVTRVLHGSAGVGKTHTITWIMNWINKKEDPLTIKGKDVKAISINAPVHDGKKGFSIIYSSMMGGIGKADVVDIMNKFWRKARDELKLEDGNLSQEQIISKLQSNFDGKIENRDLAMMVFLRSKITAASALDNEWWNWMCGLSGSSKWQEILGVSPKSPAKDSEASVKVLKEFFC